MFNSKVEKIFIKYTRFNKNDILSIKKIHSGYSNANFLVSLINNEKYQVRISKGINKERQNELAALMLMKDRSFVYFNTKGNAIKKWIEGDVVKEWNDELLIKLIKKIKQLHTIKPTGLIKHNYKERLYVDLPNKYLEKYLLLVDKYKNDKHVFSHNDINTNNIIVNNNEPFLIDFEYARANSKYFDIANLIKESNFNKKEIKIILKAYQDLNETKLNDYIYINLFYSYTWALKHSERNLIRDYKQRIRKQLLDYKLD